jgi:hypothetical protein
MIFVAISVSLVLHEISLAVGQYHIAKILLVSNRYEVDRHIDQAGPAVRSHLLPSSTLPDYLELKFPSVSTRRMI